MPVVVTGRKPTCWKCGETDHFYFCCPEKKASAVLYTADPNLPLVESVSSIKTVIGLSTIGTKKTLTAACELAENEKWEWLVFGK